MDPLTIALVMGGTALMADQQNKQTRKMNKDAANAAAAQTQFSPWTGHGPGKAQFQAETPMANALAKGAITGASMSQQFDQAQQNKNLADSQVNMNNAQADYYTQQQSTPWLNQAKVVNNYGGRNAYNMGMQG